MGEEDLFSYIIDQIFTEIEEIMYTRKADWHDLDALSIFMQKVYTTVELNKKKPEYVQITFLQSRDKTQFVRQFFEISEAQKKNVLQLFERDKKRGIIREDVDSSLIIDMVHILSKELFFTVGMDSEEYINKIEVVIETIRKGIGRHAK